MNKLKNKIQQLINQRENLLNHIFQHYEEIATLKRLRDLEGEELLCCLG
jgi:hypothetical protein